MITTPRKASGTSRKSRIEIDPVDLASAIEFEAAQDPLDFRTRLLVRDSLVRSPTYWGEERVADWLAGSPQRPRNQFDPPLPIWAPSDFPHFSSE